MVDQNEMVSNNPSDLRKANRKRSSTRTRTITAIFIIAFALPLVILGDWFFFGLIVLVLFGALFEIIKCGQIKYTFFLYFVTFLISISMMVSPLIRMLLTEGELTRIFSNFVYVDVSPFVIFIFIVLLFFTVVVDKNFTIRDACFMLSMVLIITFGLQNALFVRYYPIHLYYQNNPSDASGPYFNLYENFYSCFLLLFVAISAILSDTGGYFFGMLFGHYKMNERISPKKTWEGFVGGVATSFFICSLIGLLIPVFSGGKMSLLDGVLDLEHWYNILLLAFVLPTISVLGDFIFSSIKRFYGIKDFGKIFPGHGGVLDRIDSLLFSFMAAGSYIYMFMVFME